MILPLTDGQYLEVVEVLDHPASDKAPFGQADRSAVTVGRRLARLGGRPSTTSRHTSSVSSEPRSPGKSPTRRRRAALASGRLQGPAGADPQSLLFFVEWQSGPSSCTRRGETTGHVTLSRLEIAGDPQRVAERLFDHRPTPNRSPASTSSGSRPTAHPASSPQASRTPRRASSGSERESPA